MKWDVRGASKPERGGNAPLFVAKVASALGGLSAIKKWTRGKEGPGREGGGELITATPPPNQPVIDVYYSPKRRRRNQLAGPLSGEMREGLICFPGTVFQSTLTHDIIIIIIVMETIIASTSNLTLHHPSLATYIRQVPSLPHIAPWYALNTH